MEKIPKRIDTKEFKEQAARLVIHEGVRLTEAARRLSISVKTLANWVVAACHGKALSAGKRLAPVTELEAEARGYGVRLRN